MTLEEVEKMEKAVYHLHGPMFPDPYGRDNDKISALVNSKVIYYIKLGVRPDELENKAEMRRVKFIDRISEQNK